MLKYILWHIRYKIYSIQELIRTLKKARESKNLSQQALSEKVNVPQSHISKIESGKVDIQLSNFLEIARILDFEVMLVPRQSVNLIKQIIASDENQKGKEIRPAYVPDEEEDHD
jgi:predicted transcriptional regulator